MAKKTGPYIGVTGFMSNAEVKEALVVVPHGTNRRLMVGVLMSSKTLNGQKNKQPNRYPEKERVANIFVDDPRVLNLVHYSTDAPEMLFEQLVEITELAGPHLDGFQLNITWPQVSQLEDYRKLYPDKFLLLQIGGRAMSEAESIDHFKLLVGQYTSVIDAILVDSSGGKGEPLNPIKGAEYLRSARDFADLGLGIAGGLCPHNLHLLDALVREFPDLNIDAEGRLRTHLYDIMDIPLMLAYLKGAFQFFLARKLR